MTPWCPGRSFPYSAGALRSRRRLPRPPLAEPARTPTGPPHRQVEPWEQRALNHLRAGQIADAVAAYDNRQRIIVVADSDTLRERVIGDWFTSHHAGEKALMIAAHRNEVRDLNERVHELVDAAGQLGATRLVVGRLEFAEGDRVMAVGRNHYDLEILNGDLGTVTHIDPHTRTVTFVCDRDGHSRVMPAAPIEAGNLDYGYARTNHQAQGATVDRTFTLGDDGDLDRQAAYTALSRGRLENRLYVLQPDNDLLPTRPTPREPVRSHVEHELSRDRSQRLASDHLNQNPELPTELRSPPAVPDSSHDVGIDLW